MTRAIITRDAAIIGLTDFVLAIDVSTKGTGWTRYPIGVPVDLRPEHRDVIEAAAITFFTPEGGCLTMPVYRVAEAA